MPSDPSPLLTGNIKRRNWGRLARDILLLPPALLYVVVERVFWVGAKRLLRRAERWGPVESAQARLETFPAWAVLPMFLVPEVFSHVAGFWASALLVRREWLPALLIGGVIKGLATLAEVWIYQSCEQKLLSVRWFAWLHGKFQRGRDWVAARTKPVREAILRLAGAGGSGIARRFAALRKLLAVRLGLDSK